jgi:hypothetical protein
MAKQTLYQRGGAVKIGSNEAVFLDVFHRRHFILGSGRPNRRQRVLKNRADDSETYISVLVTRSAEGFARGSRGPREQNPLDAERQRVLHSGFCGRDS